MQIIQLLQHIDLKHLNDIITAIKLLFEIVTDILNDIKPCATDPATMAYITRVIEKIASANIYQIAMNVILHLGKIIQDLMGIVNAFQSHDIYNVGKNLGDFIYIVLLSSPHELVGGFTPEDLKNLLLGILEGLRFPDIDVLLKCVDKMKDVYNKIV